MNFGKRYAKERLVSAYIYSDYLTFFEELHTFKCNRGNESAGWAGSFTLSRAEVRRPATATWTHWTLDTKAVNEPSKILQCLEKTLTRASSLFNAPARTFTIENIRMLVCQMGILNCKSASRRFQCETL